MRNKKIISAVLVLIILAGGIFFLWKKNYKTLPKEDSQIENNGQVINNRSQAESIAKDFLSRQSFKDDYKPDPISVEVYTDFWNVWFATQDQNKKPNRGLVQIDTKTGKAEWKELQ
jgi:hypothetical protein